MKWPLYLFILWLALVVTLVFPLGIRAQNNPGGQATTQSGSQTPSQEAQQSTASFLDQLRGVYRVGLAIVGLAALVYIIWGGIEYIVAGESKSLVESGRSRIKNALIGILVAAISFALLRTINPDLVSLNFQAIPPVALPNTGIRPGEVSDVDIPEEVRRNIEAGGFNVVFAREVDPALSADDGARALRGLRQQCRAANGRLSQAPGNPRQVTCLRPR